MATPKPFLFIFLLQLSTAVAMANTNNSCQNEILPKFSAILAFGDSLFDTGNNNYVSGSIIRSNHQPYGEDFPGNLATGRFSDGKLVPDLLSSILGIKEFVPPFLSPYLADEEILTGVSFASAGSGYDDLTGIAFKIVPMSKQSKYLKKYIERLRRIVGIEKAQEIVGNALVIIGSGTNDLILNFYDFPIRKVFYDISEYHNLLLNKLQSFVKNVYGQGCRRILVGGLPPIGCLPFQITAALQPPVLRTCVDKQNLESEAYNAKLEKLLPRLQASLPGSQLQYVDIYNPWMDMINNPNKYGLVETIEKGCCGSGLVEFGALCSAVSPLCRNTSQYLFFDSIHLTETAYRHIAEHIAYELLLTNVGCL